MKLDEYLKQFCVSPAKFSREIGIPLATFYTILKGRMPRADVAIQIEDGTHGRVKYRELVAEIKEKQRNS